MSHLPRIASPQVLIDGVAVKDWNLRTLRSQIGLVQQESVTFGVSILENIMYNPLPDLHDHFVIFLIIISSLAKRPSPPSCSLPCPDRRGGGAQDGRRRVRPRRGPQGAHFPLSFPFRGSRVGHVTTWIASPAFPPVF
jgi:hypothetical protein